MVQEKSNKAFLRTVFVFVFVYFSAHKNVTEGFSYESKHSDSTRAISYKNQSKNLSKVKTANLLEQKDANHNHETIFWDHCYAYQRNVDCERFHHI